MTAPSSVGDSWCKLCVGILPCAHLDCRTPGGRHAHQRGTDSAGSLECLHEPEQLATPEPASAALALIPQNVCLHDACL